MTSTPIHWGVHPLILLTVGLGVASLVLFGVFLFTGSLHLINLGLTPRWQLALNALLCFVFFLQHSGMIRRPFRRWLSRYVPERYLGLFYTLASSIAVLALVGLWQESAVTLAAAEGPYRLVLRAVFMGALLGSLWGTWSVKAVDMFGAEAVLRRAGETLPPGPIVMRGPYRWVRHPIYLTTLLMIWSHPDLTADRLLFNVLFTLWIVAGTWLEERDLVVVYGPAYQDYQRRVPMLIPYRKPGSATG
ncbi:MAG: NnrU family protein [Gammaproteobacteria bacterium]|nr:NnrU family protein [Gammaproteobacteria bacterium]